MVCILLYTRALRALRDLLACLGYRMTWATREKVWYAVEQTVNTT